MKDSSVTDWITAIAASLACFGIVFSAIQTRLLKKQIFDDHERSRRQATVDLLWKFNEHVTGTAVADLVESLTEAQARSVVNCEPITINVDDRTLNILAVCLRGSSATAPKNKGSFELGRDAVSVIQTDALSYLNIMESILLAARYQVADSTMIESEFKFLFDATKGRNCLAHFRKSAGGDDTFPSIGVFERKLARAPSGEFSPLG